LPVEINDLVSAIVVASFLILTLVVLFGPSFFSTYRNWKIRKGGK
jgi:hypothetical protein